MRVHNQDARPIELALSTSRHAELTRVATVASLRLQLPTACNALYSLPIVRGEAVYPVPTVLDRIYCQEPADARG